MMVILREVLLSIDERLKSSQDYDQKRLQIDLNNILCTLQYFLDQGGTLLDYDGGTTFLGSIIAFLNKDPYNKNPYFKQIKNLILAQYPFLQSKELKK